MKKEIWFRLILVIMIVPVFYLTSCTRKALVVGPDQTGTTSPAAGTAGPAKSEEEKTGDSYKISDLAPEEETRNRSETERLKAEIDEFESRPIYFAFDEFELKPASRENLAQKANWLESHPEYSILIAGHCDERGTNEYNLALGDRRAETARKYLVNLGISEQRIETISYGEEKPAVRGHTEEAWSKNRRDEFRVIR